MSKSMLDPIVRALVGVDAKHHGIVLDISNKLGGENADEYRKRFAAVLGEPLVPPAPISSIICVDLSVRPAYPDWMKDVLHPELEATGPAEFDLATLDPYLYGKQKTGGVETGNRIYEHLKSEKLLDGCLNLQDALAIQAMGIEVFRKHFNGKAVFFWKSVVRDRDGGLIVPYLYEYGGQVRLGWRWLDYYWYGNLPALRFAS